MAEQRKRATIRDVAEKAGVSKSTVSLVLHNSPLVRSETKKAVNSAISQLNYVRNHAAAALRSSNSGRIGIVVNDLRTPFVADFVAAAQQALMERGLAALIATANEDPEMEDAAVRLALSQDIAGLLIAPCRGSSSHVYDAILAANIPVMQVLRQGDSRVQEVPFHSLDYAIGSHLATQHLLDQGITNIAFVGGHAGHQVSTERAAGYRDFIEVAGRKPMFIHGGATRAFGQKAMLKIARDNPDYQAAICINDDVALGMADAAHRVGRQIGRDFFVIGFDDSPEAAVSDPPLTSIRCDVAGLATNTVNALLNWVDSGARPADMTRRPVTLIKRASSQRP